MSVAVNDIHGKKVSGIELPESIFQVEMKSDVVSQVVRWQLARRRSGTHSTLRVSDISGTTKKPWRQKGTGRARQGSLRNPHFRGGATMHGPLPRSYDFALPKKVRKLALKMAVSEKLRTGNLICLPKGFKASTTKEMKALLEKQSISKALFVDTQENMSAYAKSTANLNGVDVLPTVGMNVYDLLKADKLIVSADSLEAIKERLA